MTFIRGDSCQLLAFDPENSYIVEKFTTYVNAGLTTKFMMTGSIPMRTKDYAEKFRQEMKSGDIIFAIWTTGIDGKGLDFVGTCGLHSHRDIYRSWEFRILICDPNYIGKGIGEDVTRLTVDYAFTRLNAHRVWLGVNADNVGAIKCYQKVGFKEEGRLRDEIFYYGKYVDAIRMGILESEWTSPTSDKAE